jgi:hypothetical protein
VSCRVVIPSVERGISDRGIPFDIHYIQLYILLNSPDEFFLIGAISFLSMCYSYPVLYSCCRRRRPSFRAQSEESPIQVALLCRYSNAVCSHPRHTGLDPVSQPVRARFVSVAKGSFTCVSVSRVRVKVFHSCGCECFTRAGDLNYVGS